MYLPEPVYELHEVGAGRECDSAVIHVPRGELLPGAAVDALRGVDDHGAALAAAVPDGRCVLTAAFTVDELMAAVLLGVPFPWADNIQMHILASHGAAFTRTHAEEPADESALRLLRPQWWFWRFPAM